MALRTDAVSSWVDSYITRYVLEAGLDGEISPSRGSCPEGQDLRDVPASPSRPDRLVDQVKVLVKRVVLVEVAGIEPARILEGLVRGIKGCSLRLYATRH